MPDIEERLRAGLGVLAEEVASSDDPKAELDRRLAARRRARRRAPALTAAAAAVVVTAVFVPVVANQDSSSPSQSNGGSAAAAMSTTRPGRELPVLGTITRDGETLRAVGYLQGTEYCTALAHSGDRTVRLRCEPVPVWPMGLGPSLVESRELLNGDPADDTGMLANRLVFLTDPRVATLAVRRGNGTAAQVRELDRNEHATLFLADFGGRPDGFGYTAWDADGKLVCEGIT
ncbi:MAG TPA: hypothetical protein VH969_02105 [Actinophytocola sp.]|jgi:hypothetical protein|uniref:hypothetical protein n=1 Tax=Actinophytocola sp. TaxID=1872138 RepID=UPI002F92675A